MNKSTIEGIVTKPYLDQYVIEIIRRTPANLIRVHTYCFGYNDPRLDVVLERSVKIYKEVQRQAIEYRRKRQV